MGRELIASVIEKLMADAEQQMPDISPDLKKHHGRFLGWSGFFAGAGTGAWMGSGVGIAAGPLGAIAGTLPGAIVGGIIGFFALEKMGINITDEED